MRRALCGFRCHEISAAMRAGEHQHAVHAGDLGARDIGVQAIADEDRHAGAPPRRGFIEQRTEGLACDFGLAGHRHPHCRDRGAVTRHQAAIGRPRRVDVGRHPMRTAMDRDRRLVQLFPGQVDSPTLNDGHRVHVGLDDRVEPKSLVSSQKPTSNGHKHGADLAESVYPHG